MAENNQTAKSILRFLNRRPAQNLVLIILIELYLYLKKN